MSMLHSDAQKQGHYIILLGLSVIVLIAFLLQPTSALSYPICSIEEFTVLALKKTTNTTNNTTIHFDLQLRSRDAIPTFYDTLNLTFYYKPDNLTRSRIGNATFTPSDLGSFGTIHRVGNFEARGVNWENATARPLVFRVELVTRVRSFRVRSTRRSRRLQVVAGADLLVDDQGNLINKGVTLTLSSNSGGRNYNMGVFQLVGVLLAMIVVYLHCW